MIFNHSEAPPSSGASLFRLLALIGLVIAACSLLACSTTEGFGKDVKNLGSTVEDSAARNK